MKTRILILAALAAALISCSGPSIEGRWRDDDSSDQDGKLTCVYQLAPDGELHLLLGAKQSYENIVDFTLAATIPGSWVLKKKTLTMTLDKANGETQVDFVPKSFLGILGDMAVGDMKESLAQMLTQGLDSIITFNDVKVEKDRFTYTELGQAGSATRLPEPAE